MRFQASIAHAVSANTANICMIEYVGHMIVYMNQQRRCRERNNKANFMSVKSGASLHLKFFKAYKAYKAFICL